MDPAISSFFIYLYSIPIFVANVAILLVSILCLGVTFVAGGKPIPFSKFPFNLITLLTMNNLLSSIVWTFGVTLNWSIAKIVGPDWLSKGTLGELLSYFNEIVLHGGKFFFAFNATQFLFLYLIGFVTFLLKPFDDGKIFESRYLLGVFVVSALMTFICLLCDFLWLEAKEDLLNKCAEMFRGCVIVFCVLTTFLLVFRINQLEGTKEICRIKRRIAFQFASLVVYCIVVLTPDAISSFMCYGGGNYTSLSNSTVVIINSILAVDHSVIGIVTFIYCLCIPLMKTELVLAFKSLFCFSIEPAMRRGRSRAYSYEGNGNHSLRESVSNSDRFDSVERYETMESISLIPVNDTEYNDLSTLTKLFRKNLLACSVVGIFLSMELLKNEKYEMSNSIEKLYSLGKESWSNIWIEQFGLVEQSFHSSKLTEKLGLNEDLFFLSDFTCGTVAPEIFYKLRLARGMTQEKYIKYLEPNSFLVSLLSSEAKYQAGDGGNSGSFIAFSRKKMLILKTISNQEFELFMKMLPYYYEYMTNNPKSFLLRIFGCYSIEIKGTKLKLIVTENVLNGFDDLTSQLTVYDLKGSFVNRKSGEHSKVRKDEDLINDMKSEDFQFNLSKKKKLEIRLQIEMDTLFLAEFNVMDYSLLVGVTHVVEFGAMDKRFYLKDRETSHPNVFHEGDSVFMFGVIDILQAYDATKKIERFSKLLRCYDVDGISAMETFAYRTRFTQALSKYFQIAIGNEADVI